ncbi:hypothetical protein WICPIJ_004049 [Wickerhamomyces pijperi]|uniref:Uncharacterized protein n=1 Tax=Wickerhamomyces pijperi TaxID=599730 RepID=A0A9P8Q8N2_WICPI|nr:hypothetical protein WICPIJ_004049 [Wickerhamomyces pijperi]
MQESQLDYSMADIPSSPINCSPPYNSNSNSNSNLNASSPMTPTRPSPRRLNTRTNRSRFATHSDSDSDGEDVIERINRERQEKREMSMNPLSSSSPIREAHHSPLRKFQSRAIGEKYTLRTNRYVPFRSQKRLREQRRAETQLAARGGLESMNRDIEEFEYFEKLRILNQEAERHQLNEIDEAEEFYGDDELDEDLFWQQIDQLEKERHYRKELEEMLRQEEAELEAMINDMSLGDQ